MSRRGVEAGFGDGRAAKVEARRSVPIALLAAQRAGRRVVFERRGRLLRGGGYG